MAAQFVREIGVLRLTQNLAVKSLPVGPITEEFLRTESLARVRRQAGALVAILQPGGEEFASLSESVIAKWPTMERGTIFANLQSELSPDLPQAT